MDKMPVNFEKNWTFFNLFFKKTVLNKKKMDICNENVSCRDILQELKNSVNKTKFDFETNFLYF